MIFQNQFQTISMSENVWKKQNDISKAISDNFNVCIYYYLFFILFIVFCLFYK